MPLQVRVSIPDFSNGVSLTDPIILENADDISLRKTVNSPDESISFSMPLNDPKLEYLVYTRWWECWDTETNRRLNFGPFESISRDGGGDKKNTGPGRSSLFKDYNKSLRTFYYPIDQFFDDLRFENLAGQPRASTIINKNTSSPYYGVSLRSKDDAIDEQTGILSPGRDVPERGTIKTSQFWSGTGRADYLIVDLGESYDISRVRVLLPWWGGVTINNNRSYDYSVQTSNDNVSYTTRYATPVPNQHPTWPQSNVGTTLYFGESGFEVDQQTAAANPVTARYWKFNITNTHAWYGNAFVDNSITEEWDWECGGSDVFKGSAGESPTDGTINTEEIEPGNDCYASIIEIDLSRRILGRDTITAKSYKQIENNSRQITYYHVPAAGETTTVGNTTKKFEPGTFFRNITVTFTSQLVVKDEYNTEVFSGTTSPANIKLPSYTRVIQMDGNADSLVTYADAWLGKLDAFSYGGSYSYTTITNDYAVLRFRGTSVKWFATIPSGSTAGVVSIELRSLGPTGVWSGWSTLEAALTLPTDVSAEKVWEIEEDTILQDDTTYELKITNTNGGYVSIDAFAGYWSASHTDYNEDHAKFTFRRPAEVVQLYDQRFSNGTVHEFRTSLKPAQSLRFVGDRVIVASRKGPGYGEIKIGLFDYSGDVPVLGFDQIIPIPGGNADGSLTVNLANSTEITQAIIFDSNDYFVSPGLPWASYLIGIYVDAGNPTYLDFIGVHETTGLSVKFSNTDYLDILKETCEVLQLEWDVTELGLKIIPLLGTDTDEILLEGTNTVIKISDVQDISQVATILNVSGGDIEGLPLTASVEDKINRSIIGRTIQRSYDLRSVTDFFTLIGAGRTELRKRRYPHRRVSIAHTGDLNLTYGDRFKAVTKEGTNLNLRAITIARNQSSNSGTTYELECIEWPQIP